MYISITLKPNRFCKESCVVFIIAGQCVCHYQNILLQVFGFFSSQLVGEFISHLSFHFSTVDILRHVFLISIRSEYMYNK